MAKDKKSGKNIWDDGTIRWYNRDRELHRLDGPAIEDKDGCFRYWYRNGRLHRGDGPAVEKIEGTVLTKEWWVDGRKQREEIYGRTA